MHSARYTARLRTAGGGSRIEYLASVQAICDLGVESESHDTANVSRPYGDGCLVYASVDLDDTGSTLIVQGTTENTAHVTLTADKTVVDGGLDDYIEFFRIRSSDDTSRRRCRSGAE